jgi:hypothetical protein
MLRCVIHGVSPIKYGHQTTGNTHVIWSDELPLTLFPTWGRIYVRRTPEESLVPIVKHGGDSVTVWAVISWYSTLFAPLLPFMAELLPGSTWSGWIIRCIPRFRRYFRTTTQFEKTLVPPFAQAELFSHGLKSTKVNFNIYSGQKNLNIIEPLWSVLETRARNRLPPWPPCWQTFRSWWRVWNGRAQVAETTVKRFLCSGFSHTCKAMWQVYQCCWRIYREINIFSRFWCHMFYVLYPIVTYLLTLPRSNVLMKTSLSGDGNVKLSQYRPWRPLGLREVEASTFSDIRHIDGSKVVSPMRRPLFTPQEDSWP